MSTDFRTLPGVATGQSITPRNIFTSQQANQVHWEPTFASIDGTNSRDTGNTPTNLLRAGLILGVVTATKKYRNSIIGITTANAAGAATSVSVPAAVATEVARLITNNGGAAISIKLIGPPAAAGAVATVSVTCSAAAGTTLTVSALGAAVAAGSLVCPADGSQTMVTINDAQYGIDVTDRNGSNLDQRLPRFLRGGDLIAASIINLSVDDFGNAVDTSVTTFIKAQLKAAGLYTFDSDRV
jgi:hypothetical protein